MKIRVSWQKRLFDCGNVLFMLLLIIVTAYPMVHVLFASISDPGELMRHTGPILRPLGRPTLSAYKMVLGNPRILIGYKNTLIILVLGVSLNLVMTSLGAYFLTIKGLLWRTPVMFMIVFTMYFSGGLIPSYLNIRSLGLDNSLAALIIPGAISTTNLIIMRTQFATIPDSLIESAKLDGARHLRILTGIILPLSVATVAVMVLYYGVAHWNSWFPASIYLRDRNKYPLQLILRDILIANQSDDMMAGVTMDDNVNVRELIKYALIIVATIPILCLYPFLQKYFVKGIMVGAIKG